MLFRSGGRISAGDEPCRARFTHTTKCERDRTRKIDGKRERAHSTAPRYRRGGGGGGGAGHDYDDGGGSMLPYQLNRANGAPRSDTYARSLALCTPPTTLCQGTHEILQSSSRRPRI